MLFLLFQVGEESYALPAQVIVEILPLVPSKRIQGAPTELAGVLRYRGAYVPVVDLAQLALGRPSLSRMGTRIVMVEVEYAGTRRVVGLIAERATETFSADPAAFVPFAPGPRGLVQRFRLDHALPQALRGRLFNELASAA